MRATAGPFAMKEVMEADIDWLDQVGIVKSILYSDWASSIVIVPKPDGNIRNSQ